MQCSFNLPMILTFRIDKNYYVRLKFNINYHLFSHELFKAYLKADQTPENLGQGKASYCFAKLMYITHHLIASEHFL